MIKDRKKTQKITNPHQKIWGAEITVSSDNFYSVEIRTKSNLIIH